MRDVIELITTTTTCDELGQEVQEETAVEVFAEKRAVPRVEFFSAGEHGLKPTAAFVVREIDYSGESLVRHDGTVFRVYRTYTTGLGGKTGRYRTVYSGSEMVELYCETRAGV
ncbi:MAG: phage head closure protein [Clostridiaceae bacterium]|nr:phage head closure protein [Clostridiaceae bacterium]